LLNKKNNGGVFMFLELENIDQCLNWENYFEQLGEKIKGQNSKTIGILSTVEYPLRIVKVNDYINIKIDLPSLKKESIKIEFVDKKLVIKGEKNIDEHKENEIVFDNRKYENVFLKFEIFEEVLKEKIVSRYENGVLTINIPFKSHKIYNIPVE